MRKIPTCVLTLSDLSQMGRKKEETLVTKEINLSILNLILLFTTTDPKGRSINYVVSKLAWCAEVSTFL